MPLGNLQGALVGLIGAIVSLVVGLGIIDANEAGQITAIAGTAISAIFVLANAIIHHGETPQGAPPTKTLGKP